MKRYVLGKFDLSGLDKRILYKRLAIVFLSFLIPTLSGCLKKDTDKYNPDSINNVSIINSFDENYTFNIGDTIKLDAVVEKSKPASELSYKWYYYSTADASASLVEIGNQAKLQYPIITTKQGNYVLTLEVKDVATGVSSFQRMGLTIKRSTTEGWLMLTNTQGKPNFSIVTPANELFRNILLPSDDYPDLGTPEKLFVLNTVDARIQPIAFRTSNNMYFINHDTFTINSTIVDAFTTPLGSKIMSLYSDLYTLNYYTIDNQGQVYWLRRGLPANVNKNYPTGFSVPLGGNYKANSCFLGSVNGNPVSAFFYDEAAKRFMCQPAATATRNSLYSLKSFAVSGQDKAKWDTDNFPDEFVYSESGNSDLKYIVGKNATGDYMLYTLDDIAYMTTKYPATTEPLKLTAIAPNSNTRFFAFSGKLPLFYYITDRSLYLYNISERRSTLLYTFPATESPVDLKMLKEAPLPTTIIPRANMQLAVAANTSTEGILYTFNLTNTGILDGGSFFKRFDKIAPIVSVEYKNRP